MTPPEAFPYKLADDPLRTSRFLRSPNGILSIWPCPSGVVSGIPSTMILTPLIPKADLAPKPLKETLKSCA